MAEIIETTGHIVLSLGSFIMERLEMSLFGVACSYPSIHAAQVFYQESFAFSIYTVQQATVYLREWESVQCFRICVPLAAPLPMETKASLEGGSSARGKMGDNLINFV